MRSLLTLILYTFTTPLVAGSPKPDLDGYRNKIAPFFKKHCLDCHGRETQRGKFALHTLDANILKGEHLEQWRLILERLQFGEMPPKRRPRPTKNEMQSAIAWIRQELHKTQLPGVVADEKLLLPAYGNYVDHEELFRSPPGPVIPAAARLWRMRPAIYQRFIDALADGKATAASKPFSTLSGKGIKDYSAPYFIDEPTTAMLLGNAEKVIEKQITTNKSRSIKRFVESKPSEDAAKSAIEMEFRLALHRGPTPEETQRFLALWERLVKLSSPAIGAKTMLMGILMQPEALFRQELGEGPVDKHGRKRLSQTEIAIALSYALGDHVDRGLLGAAQKKQLTDAKQLEKHIRRMLGDTKRGTPRILQFFREHFGYRNALNVFKDPPKRGHHRAIQLVTDLEMTIEDILKKDKEVLHELLTTNRFYVNCAIDRKRGTIKKGSKQVLYETTYGLPPDWKWTSDQPIELPKDERAGVLTHPAWLVAWSENFDNDPVRRGKWIRFHLLGGTVPDVPIGVDARIPEAEDKTLRERLASATHKRECWRCHRKMDPLGTPFELYDHYGRYRRRELDKPVVTTGAISLTESSLHSEVSNPIEMIRKLSQSPRVEQVFVRHVFRFFMGRNETLGDAKTLQDAYQRYRKSDGSFRALVVSLLTSDSFLMRRAQEK